MDKMPEDIDRIATDIVQMRTGDDPEWETYVAIARAILAERRRCAEVARNTRHAEFYGNPDQMHAASFIAQAIEAGA